MLIKVYKNHFYLTIIYIYSSFYLYVFLGRDTEGIPEVYPTLTQTLNKARF